MRTKFIGEMRRYWNHKSALWITAFCVFMTASLLILTPEAFAYELKGDKLLIQTGEHGEISSIQINGDAFPTEYVMNKTVSPEQNTADHQWLGELMFTYRLGGGEWTKAWTSKSADARTITNHGNEVVVTYENAKDSEGIRNFKVTEKYSLHNDGHLLWTIQVENTSGQALEIGDFGLPLPFNEQWTYGDSIYEKRVVSHSYVGGNSSYITAGRPSGIGSYLLLIPDAATDAGFEYQDRWRDEEHPGSKWAWNPVNEGKWIEGLNVFYIHSNVIKSTNRGYLDNTSLHLAPGAAKEYGFKFFAVQDENDVKDTLYEQGLLDTTVVPGMIVPTNQKAKIDLRTEADIVKVSTNEGAVIPLLESKPGGHHIYELQLNKLGPQHVTVEYGDGHTAVLQFYGIDPVERALQEHSTFMVEKTQWNMPGDLRDKVFDDWMMNTKSKRNNFSGYWGWGDDWGLTHGQFLAEKNALTPVVSEVQAVDEYLETAIWNNLMNGHHEDYLIHDFLMEEPNTTPTYRGYAYPHIYNTFFSMYKIADRYPELTAYNNPKETYLLRAYNIFKALYEGPVSYNWETGLMGELTTPDLIQALENEGLMDEANDIRVKMVKKYNNFKNTTYPYGSEYSYDNTGEEAVYTLAKMQSETDAEQAKALEMMGKINAKTRASRGHMPVWYYYADPVTITGENWWNFQYSTSLAGYAMDDWVRNHADSNREVEQRMSYAAKVANISAINSGQISSDPENIGAAAWTYQAERGNQGTNGTGGGRNVPLLNGWKGMTGEADLGLFGALQTLSADIAVDPIFGVTGYGAEVSVSDAVYYDIIPTDGLFKRLNLITERLYIELEKDQYTGATVSQNKDYVRLDMKNLTPGTGHETEITFSGLKKGAYLVKVDGETAGKLNAFGTEAKLNVKAGTAVAYTVELSETTPDDNKAPLVNAGADFNFTLPDDGLLRGAASDDGLPAGAITAEWSLVSAPVNGKAVFKNSKSLFTSVAVTEPGKYQFKLTASDSELSGSDLMEVTVAAAPPLPELLALYSFDEEEGKTAADISGNGADAAVLGSADWVSGKRNNALSLSGKDGYLKLPEGVVSRAETLTVATWVKANSVTDYSRIFDIGSGTGEYMFLSPKVGSGIRFAITTGGNAPGAEQMISGPALAAGQWKHIAVTLSGNTGILYVDGVEAGRNSNMTLTPASLGKTKNNFIGKSQFPDPYFDGLLDDFRIYSKALSAAEIAALVAPAGDIVSVEAVNLTTPAGTAPKLPSSLKAKLADGSSTEVTLQWQPVDPASYAVEGNSFTITGTIVGTDRAVQGQVTVTARVIDPFPALVLRYNFDESQGTAVKDASGAGHDGTLHGKLSWDANGHKQSALTFSGVSGNFVEAGTDSALQPGSLTLSYWIKRTQTMNDKENVLLWFKPAGNYTGSGFFVTYSGNSSIVFVDGANGFYVKESPDEFLPLNEWTHVVVTFDAAAKTPAIYKNGVAQEVDINGTPQSITATNDVKKIGVSGYGDGAQLNAGLDDFRIYSGAMTAAQVKALYEDCDVQSVATVTVSTYVHAAPVLPDTVEVQYENGGSGSAAVSWAEILPEQYAQPGQFTVSGSVEGTALPATVDITVIPAPKEQIVSLEEVKVTTAAGTAPTLPSVIQATYGSGLTVDVNVAWADISPERYAAAGSFEVEGSVEGIELKAKAIVTVVTLVPTPDPEPSVKPTPVPSPEPTPGPTPSPIWQSGAAVLPSVTPSATSGTMQSEIKVVGEEWFKENPASPAEVKLDAQENAVSLPVNAGALLGTRPLLIVSGEASVTIPAAALTALAAGLPDMEAAQAKIIVRLAQVSSASPVQSGGGIAKLEGPAYTIALTLRTSDGAEHALKALPKGITAALSYAAGVKDERLLGLYLLDEASGRWSYAAGAVDTAHRQVAAELTRFGTYAVLSYDRTFSDVPAGHWAYGTVKELAARHVISGASDTLFQPQGATTRAEFTAMLVRVLGLQSGSGGKAVPFSDVPADSWYAQQVSAAYEAGLIQGVSAARFAPGETITREQMAVLLVKAYEYKLGSAASAEASADATADGKVLSADSKQVSAWAQGAVDKVLASGLMQGNEKGVFDPHAQATRAQTAQAVYNFLKLVN